ncbi:hypothetical protein D3C85_1562450 [compost metagenome]
MGAEGYIAFKQKNDKGEQHAKNTFLVMDYLSGAKAGNSSNELVLPFVRQSQADLYAGKALGTEETIKASATMAENMAVPVTLKLDTAIAAQMKQFKEQVVTPNIQALYSGEKSPEDIAQEFISKGSQMLNK